MIDRWDSADNDDDTNLAMIYISLSENRKAEHDIIALMKLKLYGQSIHIYGVPMVYGDYETLWWCEAYQVYEVEPYPMTRNVGLK